ncbi:MBL fold metallo-hydrolase [Tabrizicola sp. J26]|uniref:MBL fold metallo-hydrolase n=1 Tax=Alitabrizicola rongguiensis TaxID=2909234 RepID=UPI001F2B7CA4|nr:MBL fold metallo-hydrolase [Tabrizicola rongguiensis]MCF1708446.1 MBL fold metallo-hydrolase [Tabrizicola rongguiensis]
MHIQHLRVLEPAPGIFAYCDGRVPGQRFMTAPNWVDEGALSLGIAAYALVRGEEALVYDPHVSTDHARAMRAHLAGLGVQRFTLVLSHHHLDHIAGTEAFADCEIIANARTLAHLERDGAAIESGTLGGPPAIAPLVLPNRIFSGKMTLILGGEPVELIETEIHSDDATVVWLPSRRILLAGDTLEDCVTYVVDPHRLSCHIEEIGRLRGLGAVSILPNHGDPGVIASGGYSPAFLDATEDYIRWLIALPNSPGRATEPLQEVIGRWLDDGALRWFDGYLAVHAQNMERVLSGADHET